MQIVSENGLKQYRTAETEKYPHVTYFFNGGVEVPFPGEKRNLIPSPRVATYDMAPEMSAEELTFSCSNAIKTGDYSFVVINFANPDMVGHTGNMDAAIKAIETVDRCIKIVCYGKWEAVFLYGTMEMLITALWRARLPHYQKVLFY